ncbi:MAG: hypothetical protein US30_C0014G0003 [Candidatus Moranbacteria bacterium GW2011_GWF2_36_839]|nr:MAG: hypothetical protein US27_C0014G0021 [Candidatus Moranbacteria bacterium GW2011_GWF1_36_78]KKQ16564.1 MAG: hypothetical protein US30_C0014G0003 [Candidatus Moranbacteria bacterium GW2011_GWF2_36_839]HAT73974.1 hypothetical protein [Candidatus Moranbacteria bacterium]HBY10888.1 hypothetical protein [Candidatus Moranbacteria bacterium]
MNEQINEAVISKACEVISSNLGEMTAGYYREFYKNKSPDIILSSLNELLLELVGSQNAEKQINEVKKLIKI